MAKELNLITLTSRINDNKESITAKRESLEVLFSMFDVSNLTYEEYCKNTYNQFTVVFIASGGTEEQFIKIAKDLPKPLLIISDSYQNSLAASMEIATWLKQNKIPYSHINIPADPSHKIKESVKDEILYLSKIQAVYSKISNYRVALFGGESPWLISSGVDKQFIREKYGISFIDYPISFLADKYNNEGESDPLSIGLYNLLKNKRVSTLSEDAIKDAVKLYKVTKDICTAESIDAITIKCFDLISQCNTTACLALALLNDNGIVAGCEGDIPSLWSMIIAKELCNQQAFMSNPSSIERIDNSIDFAHCTAPLNMGEHYTLTTHYETGMGVGIRSEIKLGKYTLFKCAGERLDKFYIFSGDLVQNTSVAERCRTQVKFLFKSEDELNDFLNSGLGNHTILIPGKHVDILTRFIKYYNNS